MGKILRENLSRTNLLRDTQRRNSTISDSPRVESIWVIGYHRLGTENDQDETDLLEEPRLRHHLHQLCSSTRDSNNEFECSVRVCLGESARFGGEMKSL